MWIFSIQELETFGFDKLLIWSFTAILCIKSQLAGLHFHRLRSTQILGMYNDFNPKHIILPEKRSRSMEAQ